MSGVARDAAMCLRGFGVREDWLPPSSFFPSARSQYTAIREPLYAAHQDQHKHNDQDQA